MNAQKDALRTEVKAFVVDKNIDLEDRWQIFLESKLGEKRGSICDWDTLMKYVKDGKKEKYAHNNVDDRFVNTGDYHDRHEIIYVADIYDTLLEQVEDAEYHVAEALEADGDIPEDDLYHGTIFEYIDEKEIPFGLHSIDEWREEVLSKFIRSYEFDW